MKKKHVPKRSEDDARVTFQLPKSLLEKIDSAAAAAFQNRSQFLVMHMTRVTSSQIASDMEKSKPAPLMMVAEQEAKSSPFTPAHGAPPVKYQGGRRNRNSS